MMAEPLSDRLGKLRRFGMEHHYRIEPAELSTFILAAARLEADRATLKARLEVLLDGFEGHAKTAREALDRIGNRGV